MKILWIILFVIIGSVIDLAILWLKISVIEDIKKIIKERAKK